MQGEISVDYTTIFYWTLCIGNDRLYSIDQPVFMRTALILSVRRSWPPRSAKWQGHVLQFVGWMLAIGMVGQAKHGSSGPSSGQPSVSSLLLYVSGRRGQVSCGSHIQSLSISIQVVHWFIGSLVHWFALVDPMIFANSGQISQTPSPLRSSGLDRILEDWVFRFLGSMMLLLSSGVNGQTSRVQALRRITLFKRAGSILLYSGCILLFVQTCHIVSLSPQVSEIVFFLFP